MLGGTCLYHKSSAFGSVLCACACLYMSILGMLYSVYLHISSSAWIIVNTNALCYVLIPGRVSPPFLLLFEVNLVIYVPLFCHIHFGMNLSCSSNQKFLFGVILSLEVILEKLASLLIVTISMNMVELPN